MRYTKEEQQGQDAKKTKWEPKENTAKREEKERKEGIQIENKLKAIQKRFLIEENLIDLTRRERKIYLQTIN